MTGTGGEAPDDVVEGPRRAAWPYYVSALLLLSCCAAIAIPSLIEARKQGGEAPWIGALRTLSTAQALFREGDKDEDGVLDYAGSLEELRRARLIDAVLATGTKQGYTFRVVRADELGWAATASPVDPEGRRWGFIDESGVIRFSTTGVATSADTPIGG